MDYEALMRKARAINTKRDKDDKKAGFAAPPDTGPYEYLRTAKFAIECGIKTDDWDAVAEGLAMIEDILSRYTPIRVKQ